MTDDGRPFLAETAQRKRTRAGWGLTPVTFVGTMQPALRPSSVVVVAAAHGRRMKINLKLRLGLLTRLHLRVGATGASNPSSVEVEMTGGGGRWGGQIWSFEWGLTPNSISELMHSELHTHPQWRGRGGNGLRHLTLGGFGIFECSSDGRPLTADCLL